MKKHLTSLLALLPFLAFSQNEFYNAGALVYIQPQAIVHVQGTVTNQDLASSQLYNDGTLEIEGNLNTTGTNNIFSYYTPSVNTAVKFVGNNAKQEITGSFNTSGNQQIYNLVVSQKSAADTVELENSISINGSLVFGSQKYTTTYHPSVYWTDNGSTGLLKTFSGNTSPGNFTQYLLNIPNGLTDAIAGYPAMEMTSPVGQNPNTGYVLTSGVRGNPLGLATYTGLQRNVSLIAAYDYPVGTIAHGYNALQMNMTSLPSGAVSIAAGFNDGTSRGDGFEGGLTDEIICSVCSANGTPGPPAAGQPSFNYYFTSNPCSATDGPLWVILQQSTKNSGYWSVGSTSADNTYQYWVKGIMNNFSDDGSPLGTWRILQDNNGSGVSRYYTDPTTDDWTSQITTSIPTPMDLIYYSAYTTVHGATNTSCYPLELNDANFGVPGGIYTGGGHFASFRENENNALPVTLTSLTAMPVNNQYIQVAWETSLEINNSGFEVQRSTDGINFTDMGWVAGHGNTTVPENYAYNDYNVTPNQLYYYQLRQVDFNGNTKYTNVVSAEITGSGYFSVGNFIPNPTSNASKIVVTTSAALTIDVKLYDVIGQQLTGGKSYNLVPGENDVDFETQGFAAGNYTAVISAGNKVYTKRLVVTKD